MTTIYTPRDAIADRLMSRGVSSRGLLGAWFALSIAFAPAVAAQKKHTALEPTSALASPTVRITSIGSAIYNGKHAADDEARCKRWRLSGKQAVQFFQLCKRYEENPYSRFYQASCAISGELIAEGKIWRFEIDGGGTATWQHEGEVRHWGCSAPSCEPLVMLLTDFMDD